MGKRTWLLPTRHDLMHLCRMPLCGTTLAEATQILQLWVDRKRHIVLQQVVALREWLAPPHLVLWLLAFFAKLNGLRLANGKAPLGFLNPFIYQNAASFQDVTSGINDDGKKGKGFTAVAGWDAATGVGTPHYDNLAKVVMIGAADRSIVV